MHVPTDRSKNFPKAQSLPPTLARAGSGEGSLDSSRTRTGQEIPSVPSHLDFFPTGMETKPFCLVQNQPKTSLRTVTSSRSGLLWGSGLPPESHGSGQDWVGGRVGGLSERVLTLVKRW